MQNFLEGMAPVAQDNDLWPWNWLAVHPSRFNMGWSFSVCLLGILLIHEFGHYFACRWHGIRASLPWVLPAPTLSGTAGAVMKIRSCIPSRNALMDVGMYGPLAGYLASALAVALGFVLSHPAAANAPEALIRFGGEPLTLRMVHALLLCRNPNLPVFEHLTPHPVLVAGWIGLFFTSLNLIPAGQLDGGHLLYALSPKTHRGFTRILPLLLLVAGALFWVGWILWGLMLLLPAMRHPRIALERPLHRGRVLMGIAGMIIFLLTFTPTPFHDNSLLQILHINLIATPLHHSACAKL
jgi:membrane-associated protease RseP (regulator of RpoE activity)